MTTPKFTATPPVELREAARRWNEHCHAPSDGGPYWGEDITYQRVFREGKMEGDLVLLANYAVSVLADETPATAEWLKEQGWELSKPKGLRAFSQCGRLSFETDTNEILHGEWGEVLIASPTRAQVLGLLAVLGPKA